MKSTRQPVIALRVSAPQKAAFAALAASRGLTESGLLALMLDAVLERNPAPVSRVGGAQVGPTPQRLSLRLRPGDRSLVDARAASRGMKPSSYLVALIHAHVRQVTPLPPADLDALKATVGRLSAIGRRLDRWAHRADARIDDDDPMRTLRETARCVDDVRRGVAELVRGHLMSWEAGDA